VRWFRPGNFPHEPEKKSSPCPPFIAFESEQHLRPMASRFSSLYSLVWILQ